MEGTNDLSMKERIEKIKDFEARQSNYAAKKAALQLVNLTKTESRTFTVFNRTLLRGYMKNPKSNESNIRNLARFLKRYSMPLNRLINYFANMIDLTAKTVIPMIDPTVDQNPDDVLKTFYETLKKLEQMSLETEIFKVLLTVWTEGTAYGYVYDDDDSFFIHMLDGEYCKVWSIDRGVCRMAFDFSYFRSRQELLDYWAPEFKKKYDEYQKDTTNMRWQPLDVETTICLKLDLDDPTMSLPPFLPLFETLISLIDLQSIQDAKDALSAYKLLVAEMEVNKNSTHPDEFTVDPDTAIAYFDRMTENLPPQVAAAISPLPIKPIEFKGTTTEDEDRISASMSNLFKASGGSQVLSNDKSGTTIFEAQILSDSEYGISSLLPQIQKWTNLYLDDKIGEGHAIVKYLEVSVYTKEKKKKSLLESGQNGIPVKLAVAAIDGFSPLETISLEYLENQVLKLQEKWIPFSTSYTQSNGNTSNEKDPEDLTDEGSATREKEKNGM